MRVTRTLADRAAPASLAKEVVQADCPSRSLVCPRRLLAGMQAAAPAQRLEPLGVHTLRGVREPQEIYALTAVEPVG